MGNNLSLAGGQPQKQTKFAPIFTSRFFSGLWTNRSPLRDATTSRIVEKFYGQAGDALIAGTNCELSTKLTLTRRPGMSVFDDNPYTNPDRFYDWRLFGPNTEEILIIVDQANAVFSLQPATFGPNQGTQTLLFEKTTTNQGSMQSVGNILYYGDGAETKKVLNSLFVWTPNTALNTSANPFFTTFFFDVNNKILQLVGTSFPITSTSITPPTTTTAPILTIGSNINLNTVLSTGTVITFPAVMVATELENQSATITSIATNGLSMVVTYPLNTLASGSTTEAVTGFAFGGGNPTTGTTQPVATVGEQIVNTNGVAGDTVGFGAIILPIAGLSLDGSAMWVSRTLHNQTDTGIENIGIGNTNTVPITFPVGSLSVGTSGAQANIWTANTTFGANDIVVDSNNNIQMTTAGGMSGAVEPTWQTELGQTTADGTIVWTLVYTGALTASNGGWVYCVALVNTLDNTVSNASPISAPTGNFIGSEGIRIGPGMGLPTVQFTQSSGTFNQTIDPQADYVAIFRSTDGQVQPFLIPSANGVLGATLPLSEYLINGYIDTTPDTGLDNLVEAPILGENTPVDQRAINFTYHLGSLWYSIGNVVFWTSGPNTPIGNGLNGTNPLNTDSMPSLVKRLVPTASGMMVFTISDTYLIQGSNTVSSPILPATPILPGIGVLSYNAIDVNGAVIGLFTTDNQFLLLDPSSGVTVAAFPIADQLLLNNGTPGQSWNPAKVYVAWHSQGTDQAWYIADGVNGWYRGIVTPSPEGPGYTWAPFATIVGGAGAVQSIEVMPGIHRLLAGLTVTDGPIFERNLNVFTDDGVPYPANVTVGSAVLAQPGQIAEVAFITTEAVRIGTPLTLGILVDEALPYYTGPIDLLQHWEPDPTTLRPSRSLYAQRFYLDELEQSAAAMRHCQIQVIFSPYDTVMNEVFTLTIFGGFLQEL
jgi:hypothetical protein